MKIYFNRGATSGAIAGALIIMGEVINQLKGQDTVHLGNVEIWPLMIYAFGAGLMTRFFTPASRKVPASLSKPRKTKWKLPPDQAFDKLKKAMAVAAVQNSAKGIQDWQPAAEDREKGLLEYKRKVEDHSDELTNPGAFFGDMTLNIQLTAAGSGTEVTNEFKVLSELTTIRIIEVVAEANSRIDGAKS